MKARTREVLLTLGLFTMMLGCLLYFSLWIIERDKNPDVSGLCVKSAYSSLAEFNSFLTYREDNFYTEGIADFRCFYKSYELMEDAKPENIKICERFYHNLVWEKESCTACMENITEIFEMLTQDHEDERAYEAMEKINTFISQNKKRPSF